MSDQKNDPAITALPQAVQELRNRVEAVDQWLREGGNTDVAVLLQDLLRALEQGRAQAPSERELALRAASEFVRDIIEALGKPQPPLDALVDLPALAMEVVGQIEELKAEQGRAQASAAPAAWRPIETAPQDEWVLLYRPKSADRNQIAVRKVSDWCGPSCCPSAEPTHWMPLPAAPPSPGDHQ